MKKEKVYREIIKETLDLHVHVGPEVLPRKYTAGALVETEKGKLGGVCLKSHFFATTPFIRELKSVPKNFRLVGSIVLNNAVGGLNPEAITAAASLSDDPIVVWFPTISAQEFLDQSEYEIRPEWVTGTNYRPRKSSEVKGIRITKDSRLTVEAVDVLQTIKKVGAVLATGHVSWQESQCLVEEARKMEIRSIIVTHPIYQLIEMPVVVQKELTQRGAFIEVCYSMFSIDGVPIRKIADQIKTVGVESCIMSSDVGQVKSPSPSSAVFDFVKRLELEGFAQDDFYQMLVTNPHRLIAC